MHVSRCRSHAPSAPDRTLASLSQSGIALPFSLKDVSLFGLPCGSRCPAWLAAPGGTTSALSSEGQPRSWRPFGELNHPLRALDGAVPLSDLTLQTEARSDSLSCSCIPHVRPMTADSILKFADATFPDGKLRGAFPLMKLTPLIACR